MRGVCSGDSLVLFQSRAQLVFEISSVARDPYGLQEFNGLPRALFLKSRASREIPIVFKSHYGSSQGVDSDFQLPDYQISRLPDGGALPGSSPDLRDSAQLIPSDCILRCGPASDEECPRPICQVCARSVPERPPYPRGRQLGFKSTYTIHPRGSVVPRSADSSALNADY